MFEIGENLQSVLEFFIIGITTIAIAFMYYKNKQKK
jgi:hypothetical protein